MDVNLLRALITLACFIVFLGIVVWAYSAKRSARFDDAARVPLEEEREGARDTTHEGSAR